jgi:hypothetical protein
MASTRPVVATRVGGIPEVVVDGETGSLVPPRDPQAAAEAILRLLADRDTRAALGRAGRMRVEQRFDLNTTVSQLLALYDINSRTDASTSGNTIRPERSASAVPAGTTLGRRYPLVQANEAGAANEAQGAGCPIVDSHVDRVASKSLLPARQERSF